MIYNGTPSEKYKLPDSSSKVADLKLKYGLNGKTVIGCVSRLKEQKQILRALPYLDEHLIVLLVGIEENEELAKIRQEIHPKQQIIYTGAVDSSEILYYHQLLNVKILPSIMEGLSQSLLEAMALGIPVVGTAFAGNLDLIVDGENGLLFENGNSLQLSQQVKAILTNPELRSKLIENGKKTAFETYSLDRTIANYERFFKSIID